TPSNEYRTIVSSLGTGRGAYYDGGISPDGRLLALGMGHEGDRLWDLATGRELAGLPTRSHCLLFQDAGALLACSVDGLQRWTIEKSTGVDNELRLGPPRRIAAPFVPERCVATPDGRTLALIGETAGAGALLDATSDSLQLLAHAKACFVALSRDGRWAASSGWHSDRVRLWNAKSGEMLHEWILGTMTQVFFTPDSRTLIICRGDAFTFWDLETLRPIRRLEKEVALYPGYVAFSPDGALMALEVAPAVIHLKEVATGRTVAKLEDPHGDRAGWMGFTPDGTQLVVTAHYAKAIHVWDLRAMRERLKGIGLDWKWPEFRPADARAKRSAPLNVEVRAGALGKEVLTREEKARRCIARYAAQIEADPDNALSCNNLAWAYLTAPVPLRDVKAALPLAEHAVQLAKDNVVFRNTLGVAYYRLDRYREAVEMLHPNLAKQDDKGLACDLYFLAMSYHHLGEPARAQDYLAWAVRWTDAQRDLEPAQIEELNLFRAEAMELLKHKPTKGKSPIAP
ncbi:MAG: hypothetical protein U0793_33805, partial [Gemmataceae bacterium]